MNLENRLRRAVEGVPHEGAVTLPVRAVRQWLEEAGSEGEGSPSEGRGEPVADLTVEDIAEAHDKSPSTVRDWLQGVPGVYRLGAELRISRSDWRAYLDGLADDGDDEPPRVRSYGGSDLGDWREERR